jgi:hypothetical protein
VRALERPPHLEPISALFNSRGGPRAPRAALPCVRASRRSFGVPVLGKIDEIYSGERDARPRRAEGLRSI